MKFRATWYDKNGIGFEAFIDADFKVGAQRQWTAFHCPDQVADQSVRFTVIVTCCTVEIPCDNFTSTCDHCGTDYNSAGQRLAPRSQWGEETGEHWSECY